MLGRLLERVRDWSIVIVGLCIIIPLFYVASLPSQQPQPAASIAPAANTPQNKPTISGQNAPSPPAAPEGQANGQSSPAPARTTAQTQPAAPTSPAAPHQHAAAATQAQPAAQPSRPAQPASASARPAATSGQAPQQSPTAATNVQGDVAAGGQVFRKCQACHALEPGKNLVGPSLAGVIGRESGTAPNYNYSSAMKNANITWNEKTLDAYLTDPQKVVPGNKMPFPGLKTQHDRTDIIAFLAASSRGGAPAQTAQQQPAPPQPPAANAPQSAPEAQAARPPNGNTPQTATGSAIGYIPDARYTLRSGIAEGRMVFIGVGGAIDGKVNPVLTAAEGQVVQLTLINGEGAEHDIVFPDQDARSPRVTGKGASTTIAFRASKAGDFVYYCSVPGHRLAGMQGQFVVTPQPPAQTVVEADISREPTDLPPPIGKRDPQTVRVDLLSVEVEGRLAEGTTFGYWTFNGKVPGPFIRVRVGDTVDIHLKNSADSTMIHSVDFHAATGPGGGAASLQVDPGAEESMTWKALEPGLYVYHCATPMVAEHIANGMYGLILVEPEGGLPPVDREFYVMQGEIYTDQPFGQGNYTLVDHALARAERGLLGILHVEGPPNPDIYNGHVMTGMGH